MGFQVKKFDSRNISQLTIPGKAVSTLFWAIPVGDWDNFEVNKWWKHFVLRPSCSKNFGLFIVKEQSQSQRSRDDDQFSPADDLKEFILNIHPEYRDGKSQKSLLILSGAYLQSGWAVQINDARILSDPQTFEIQIKQSLDKITSTQDLEVFNRVNEAFRARKRFQLMPQHSGKSKILQICQQLNAILDFLLIKNINDEELRKPIDQLNARVQSLEHLHEGRELHNLFNPDYIALVRQSIQILRWRRRFLSLDESDQESIIAIFKNPSQNEMENQQGFVAFSLRMLTKISEFLPEINIASICDSLDGCIEDQLSSHNRLLDPFVEKLKTISDAAEKDYLLQREKINREIESWKQQRNHAESNYRQLLPDAIQLQWDLGPKFLTELEKRIDDAFSVFWEPSRMIGWKTLVAFPDISLQALRMAANSTLPIIERPELEADDSNEVSGSLFSDYVHYLSIHARRTTKREIVIELLGQLLSPRDMGRLGIVQDNMQNAVTELLSLWGWPMETSRVTIPLASCIKIKEAKFDLVEPTNNVRISLENFLKELIQISLTKLGWKQLNDKDLNLEISTAAPSFKFEEHKSIQESLKKITGGAAIVLLKGLLPLAFPSADENATIDTMLGHAQKAVNDLNSSQHDNESKSPNHSQLAKCLKTVLAETSKIVGDMPWHLMIHQSIGHNPAVITGHAWSHSHAEDREIRVLEPIGMDSRQQEIVIWNHSGINPVMTDVTMM